ncbi:MAG: PhoH family protein [Solirubrobacterales bacterium]|nr:PhoH family protein [Solirubrobacterales bacterium]
MVRKIEVSDRAAVEIAGEGDRVLRALEDASACSIRLRGNLLKFDGDQAAVAAAVSVVTDLAALADGGHDLDEATVRSVASALHSNLNPQSMVKDLVWSRGTTRIAPKTPTQKLYVDAIRENTISFGIGPAGTGKTYLAVAMAVSALSRGEVKRVILSRPAVEAGERLGFLPGDLMAKVDPYLRPLFDALHEMLDPEQVMRHLERGVIEVAPLAFMRGRTLNDSFVILDEAQNTTPEQMKMFLTRLGFGSRMVVTGDVTQVDLPASQQSGLIAAAEVVDGIDGISFTHFDDQDVVRHHLVQSIVAAYREHDRRAAPELRPAGRRGA